MQSMTHTIHNPAVAAMQFVHKAAHLAHETGVAVFRTLVAWQGRYVERQRMRQFTSQQLRDMGVSAEQMDAAADKPFWVA